MVAEVGEMITEGAELTITLAVFDGAVTGVEAQSVTLTQTVCKPASGGEQIQEDEVAPGTAELSRYHWYVNEEVPPDVLDVNVCD
jgi:hypothetical protein